ncbi:MAG TPA: hypothetical protein VKA85_06390, partial [Candidatus Limnocylindrales bacterium]|nr:hypothetical protein [Candidatus Limnocylindrales bacterium]
RPTDAVGAATPSVPRRPPDRARGAGWVVSGDVSRALPLSPTVIRIALALIGWPPPGFALVGLLGEASGCSRFAAGCGVESFGLVTWLLQLAVIGVLLAFPRLAAISAAGTVTALAVSLPATMLLSASGGAAVREASIAALITVLAVAYVVGVAFAALRWSRRIGG